MNITVVLLQYAIPLISKFEVIFYFFSRRRSGQGGPSFTKWLRAFLLQKELNQEVRTVELFLKEALRDCIEKMTPRGTSNVFFFSIFRMWELVRYQSVLGCKRCILSLASVIQR